MSQDTENLMERRRRLLGPTYEHFYQQPVYLTRGDGVWLFDNDGKKYLDCYNNVAAVGHCHPHVVEALTRQAGLLNTHTRYLHHSILDYAEALTATLPGELSVCMFVCTGTEANDLAYQIARAVTGNEGAIIVKNTYHGGSTLVTELSPEGGRRRPCPDFIAEVEGPDPYRGESDPGQSDFSSTCAGRVDGAIATLRGRGHSPAMMMIDSIFDSPGIFTAPPRYQQTVYGKVRAAGGLIVADEVQSGLCRLGDNYWGFADSGVIPDIVTMGKPIGNGHPLAVVVTTPAIAREFASRCAYFNTYGGNPVSAEVGKAVLEVIEQDDVLSNVHNTGITLRSKLEALMDRHELIGDVRGKGLYFGVELVRNRATKEPAPEEALRIVEHMRDNGVLVAKIGEFGNIVKIRPPLVFGEQHAQHLAERLNDALAHVAG